MNDTMRKVAIARKIARPNTKEFIEDIFEDFLEFHGDRLYADDGAASAMFLMHSSICGMSKCIATV